MNPFEGDLRTGVHQCTCRSSGGATIRWRTIAGGTVIYQAQCEGCGGARGTSLKQDRVRQMLGGADPPRWNDAATVDHSETALDRPYDDYLRSDAWRAVRYKVMERAGYCCEGCGIGPATAVHHLIYEHIGAEFLWELVAVCDACHKRAHGRDLLADEDEYPW